MAHRAALQVWKCNYYRHGFFKHAICHSKTVFINERIKINIQLITLNFSARHVYLSLTIAPSSHMPNDEPNTAIEFRVNKKICRFLILNFWNIFCFLLQIFVLIRNSPPVRQEVNRTIQKLLKKIERAITMNRTFTWQLAPLTA